MIFGYPGLGKYLLESALFKDINGLEAGAMILVLLAVGTQLVADIKSQAHRRDQTTTDGTLEAVRVAPGEQVAPGDRLFDFTAKD